MTLGGMCWGNSAPVVVVFEEVEETKWDLPSTTQKHLSIRHAFSLFADSTLVIINKDSLYEKCEDYLLKGK